MSIGSVKTGGVCVEASDCRGGRGECDDETGSWLLKTLGNAVHSPGDMFDAELNHACSAAELLRDNSSRLHPPTRRN